MRRAIVGIVMAVLSGSVSVSGRSDEPSIPTKLSHDEAVAISFKVYGVTPDEAFFEPQDWNEGDAFAVFEACSVPHNGCSGWIAINMWTGDPWDAWLCKRLPGSNVKRELAGIRDRFTKEELKQYSKLHRLKPPCLGP